jgi:hypothetical protein
MGTAQLASDHQRRRNHLGAALRAGGESGRYSREPDSSENSGDIRMNGNCAPAKVGINSDAGDVYSGSGGSLVGGEVV